ncbi:MULTISPECIES: transporter substrate-binding domain-containing protein [Burkholderia cepacia complex]|uniref:transporter substrate-binding domain-containing protein n=1 Tax=Burkholderia cepacia complex TaxID=87882 RepID=UPI001B96CA3A|nr:transporter substrate-binding domain-containing protein [Burkholderia cenocepacia]MBR8319634.1 transporter substrate-binding domain-containing protein [Burkholderia cenocepacia]
MQPPIILSRLLAAGLAAVALIGAFPAHARSLQEILESKKIVFGINPNLPPLGLYDAKNTIDGFDVSVARKLADALGVKLEIVPVGSADRVPFLMADKIDAVMGGMTRNPDRLKVVDFTDPVNTEVLGVLTTQATTFKDYTQLNDPSVRLVQVRGTTPVKLIQEQLPKAQLLLLDNYPDAVRAIAQGRADALIDVLDFMLSYTKNYPTKWRVVDSPIEVDYDCIGIRKGNTALTERLNKEIATLHKTGFVAASWKRWFGGPMLHDPTAAPMTAAK